MLWVFFLLLSGITGYLYGIIGYYWVLFGTNWVFLYMLLSGILWHYQVFVAFFITGYHLVLLQGFFCNIKNEEKPLEKPNKILRG